MATPPLSTDTPYDIEQEQTIRLDHNEASSTPAPATPQPQPKITRTVAIIKNHALGHRFDIEPRIQEASFEIVKERQMEFDVESDPDTLYELFGDDAESFAEGPVWVYVLERRRAVEVWNTLMGDRDPEVAKQEAPHSLRALYGISAQKNAVMGSPDTEMAEVQIAALFASSPPFPTSDLPSDDGRFASMRSMSSSILANLRKATGDGSYATSNATEGSRGSGSAKGVAPNGKPLFKARGLPTTHGKPDIVPRTTRAAALRAGIPLEKAAAPRKSLPKEDQAKTFANIPGHKRTETIAVASTAAPTIAPRMTKAAALRLGLPPPPAVRRQASSSFEGVPGHKRRESIAVSSTQEPTVKPRLNKSASLRVTKDNAPPTSFMFRGPSEPKVPEEAVPDYPSKKSPAVQNHPAQVLPHQPELPQVTPVDRLLTNSAATTNSKGNGTAKATASPSPAPEAAADKPKLKARPSSVSLPPSIAPRTNKSAALRAAKKEQEAAAAAALAAKQQRRTSRAPPSSMPKSLAV
ncbi:hypothetical protein BDP27DRAFT_1357205 [Rhodocollybia butyracea]|uniref:Nucleoside diphosphate kinase n=1 Tax=Rhodocollybia butyracea TaxID=206335 RepID=A0A9P5QC05_9AGAR|nr:hypothetical protein BDP27DRAFT_1357205 [Rhodocollybia butyracea]